METHDILTCAHYISTTTELFRIRGITLEFGSDFRYLQDIIAAQPERNPLAPKFSPDITNLNKENSFWIIGRSNTGGLVLTQAMQLIDLQQKTLAEYLAGQFRDFVPAGLDIDLKNSSNVSTPASRTISGKVVYHGELWIKGGKDGYRGADTVNSLARLAMAMALLKWLPDYIFGFMFPAAACKGLSAREGYMHFDPGTISWALNGETTILEEWTVWMSKDDIRHLLSVSPVSLPTKDEHDTAAQVGKAVA